MEQEVEHLETFDQLLNDYKVRPLYLTRYGALLDLRLARQPLPWDQKQLWPARLLSKKSLVSIITNRLKPCMKQMPNLN